MKILRAVMLASVCALTTAGYTSAPLLDVESSGTVMIVAETPATRSAAGNASAAIAPDVTEASTTTIADEPTTTITEAPSTTAAESSTMTTQADITETTTTTVVELTDTQAEPDVLQGPVAPRP